MSKILVLSDIHNHIVEAQVIIDKYIDTHKIVIAGDIFDDFNDTAIVADQVARWLKKTFENPNIIVLMGNHDINYSSYNYKSDSTHGVQSIYNCAGYTIQKDDAINRIMTEEDWNKIKFYHFENGWIITHAGISKHWFEHPVLGCTYENIIEKINRAEELYKNREYSDVIGAAGRCRGGASRIGGILWHDHFNEAEPIRGIKQVYGHTPIARQGIDIFEENKGINVNVDCGLSQVLEINEDGSYNIIDTGLDNFYAVYQKKKAEKFKKAVDKMNIGSYDHIYKDLK